MNFISIIHSLREKVDRLNKNKEIVMYFYCLLNENNCDAVVDYLKNRALKNKIAPEITNDIMVNWIEKDNGQVFVSKRLLELV